MSLFKSFRQQGKCIGWSLIVFGCGWAVPARAESASALAQRAADYYQAEKFDEAIANYRQALALEPDSAVLQYNLGTALARKGNREEAAKVLHQAAQEPASAARPDALFNLGTSLAEQATASKDTNHPPTTGGAPPQVVAAPANDPKQQIEMLEKAQQAFREAILNDSRDKSNQEAKYNYEVTRSLLEELKKKQQEQQQQNDKDKQDQKKQDDQQQQNGQQKQDQEGQGDQKKPGDGQQQSAPTPTPTPAASPTPGGGQGAQPQASPTPAATPQPTPGAGSEEQKKNEQNQAKQDRGLEGQATPTPSPTPGQSGQKAKGQEGKPPEQKPEGNAEALGATGQVPPQQTPTPEQLNAQRLLNLLEQEKPEQFKKLYQFQGKRDQAPQKDW
jgi:Ca-activated chloride channel family protein